METQEYIARLKLFYQAFLKLIDNKEDTPELFQQKISFFKDNNFGENPDELRSILHIIYKVLSQHKKHSDTISKIQKIIIHFEDKIKQTFSTTEIFRIFKNDKLFLLFLFKQEIIPLDEKIASLIIESHGRFYSNFFYPEIKPFLEAIQQKTKIILFESDQISDENFEEKRQEGENNSYLCKLIRNDSIDEFISIYNDQKMGPMNTIQRSIFESNVFLTKNSATLIEYAAFFGSINIVRFLLNSGKKDPSNFWIYAIQSGNIEFIHKLEEIKIEKVHSLYDKYFLTAVKCHYNDIAHYIIDTVLEDKNIVQFNEEFFGYYNFEFFPDDFTDNYESIFDYACHYDYVTIVKNFINENKINIKEAIFKPCKNRQEIIKILLNNLGTSIETNYFQKSSFLNKITIPSFITRIEDCAFLSCTFLNHAEIPSSVTYIGKYAFGKCSNLYELTIPSSVTKIRRSAFYKCSKLKEFSIPSSLTKIPKCSFEGCSSLVKIEIPSSVTKIGSYSFCSCSKLEKIKIPNSVTVIGEYAFCLCSHLKEIEIPSSVTKISNYTFRGCEKLSKIVIPPNVTQIGKYAFDNCLSLDKIDIPESVTEIGEFAFTRCKSLKQISFHSSISNIEKLDIDSETKIK